jgi:hypothetical protein
MIVQKRLAVQDGGESGSLAKVNSRWLGVQLGLASLVVAAAWCAFLFESVPLAVAHWWFYLADCCAGLFRMRASVRAHRPILEAYDHLLALTLSVEQTKLVPVIKARMAFIVRHGRFNVITFGIRGLYV